MTIKTWLKNKLYSGPNLNNPPSLCSNNCKLSKKWYDGHVQVCSIVEHVRVCSMFNQMVFNPSLENGLSEAVIFAKAINSTVPKSS